MARAKVKKDRRSTDIADAIIAEWYRVLPPEGSPAGALQMDANALTAAFNQIVEGDCQAIIDDPARIKIVVPLPPSLTREELIKYLEDNDDFRQGMGAAVLFGCGK